MHSKLKRALKIWIPTVAAVTALAVTAGILIHRERQYSPLSEQQRQIMLANFEPVDYGAQKQPLKREISAEKPVNLITFYDGPDKIEPLWNALPENIRDISVLLLIPGNGLRPEGQMETLLANAEACERLKIPFAIQNINGETHAEWKLPLKYLEDAFCGYEYLYGLSSAEIYNGEQWRGQLDGDMAQYVNDCIRLCAKYGIFWFWTDTNIFGTNGTIIDWIEENEQLYDTMKENYQNIIMQNKESYGDPSTYSLMEGLYLAKLIGGWGVATDWWHWQVSNYHSLFDENDAYIDGEWERIFVYPEVMQTQSLAMVMSGGGFCFKNEAEYFTVACEGERTATFQYCTIPFFDSILSGEIEIPTREQVLEELKFAVVGGANYAPFNYDLEESNLYPDMSELGIVPLLPGNLRLEERQIFTDAGVRLLEQQPEEALYETYLDGAAEGDTFLKNTGDQWYYLNNVENRDTDKAASIQKFRQNGAQSLLIESGPHTYGIIKESPDSLLVQLNNFRLDKTEMIKTVGKVEEPKAVIREWLCVDAQGNVKKADASQYRETVLTLKVSGGFVPQVTPVTDENGTKNTQPFTYTAERSGDTMIIKIQHNGFVSMRISTPTGTPALRTVSKGTADNQPASNGALDIRMAEQFLKEYGDAVDRENIYTSASYHAYVRAYSKVKAMVQQRTCTQEALDQACEGLKTAYGLLFGMDAQAQRLKEAYDSGMTKGGKSNAKAFDTALRALLSPTVYYQGKDKTLETKEASRRTDYDAELKAEKEKEIQKAFSLLEKRMA